MCFCVQYSIYSLNINLLTKLIPVFVSFTEMCSLMEMCSQFIDICTLVCVPYSDVCPDYADIFPRVPSFVPKELFPLKKMYKRAILLN